MADLLIKGVCLPKDWEMLSINFDRDGKVSLSFDLKCEQIAEAIIVPPHGRLIDADELYEKTAEWESQALHSANKSLDEGDFDNWKDWAVVLTERSAFKHDVEDAETVLEASGDGEQDG